MKISIVVPVFNCEKHLENCIESVINQSCSNWELILVDDGSTDRSFDICNFYSNKYPETIYVYHKKNEGQFLTRKFGILKCMGDYIGFLDADDLLDKDYVETICKNIKSFSFPDSICFGFHQFGNGIDKEIKTTDSHNPIIFDSLEKRRFVYNQIIAGKLSGSMCSKVFKRDIITNCIPDENVVCSKRFAEDAYHTFTTLAHSNSILYINKTLYHYRYNLQGFSQGFETRNPEYFNSKYLFELIFNLLPIMGVDNSETRKTLYERNFNETVYFMLKFLRATKNIKRKKEIIDFDWSSYLLEGTINEIGKSTEINKSRLKVWNAFKNKNYVTIFLKEKFKRILGW